MSYQVEEEGYPNHPRHCTAKNTKEMKTRKLIFYFHDLFFNNKTRKTNKVKISIK